MVEAMISRLPEGIGEAVMEYDTAYFRLAAGDFDWQHEWEIMEALHRARRRSFHGLLELRTRSVPCLVLHRTTQLSDPTPAKLRYSFPLRNRHQEHER